MSLFLPELVLYHRFISFQIEDLLCPLLTVFCRQASPLEFFFVREVSPILNICRQVEIKLNFPSPGVSRCQATSSVLHHQVSPQASWKFNIPPLGAYTCQKSYNDCSLPLIGMKGAGQTTAVGGGGGRVGKGQMLPWEFAGPGSSRLNPCPSQEMDIYRAALFTPLSEYTGYVHIQKGNKIKIMLVMKNVSCENNIILCTETQVKRTKPKLSIKKGNMLSTGIFKDRR